MKILFLGPLYPCDCELKIKENSISNISNAPNVFQWNLLNGLHKLIGDNLKVINVLPVGIWKKEYRDFILKDRKWEYNGIVGNEIGCINLPFVKQLQRSLKTKKILKKVADKDTEIIIYSAYMPFLRATYKLPKSIKITAVITDLPEFYDLGKTTEIRKKLRERQNRMIYKYLNRIDRFVVLTKQMCEPLKIGNRPWICVEGICNTDNTSNSVSSNKIKAILYSGTLHYKYGIKNLLEAFEKIDSKDTELWICGGGEAESEIKKLAVKDSRIKFFGFCTQEKVAELRAEAAVLVNPRTNEGEYTKYSFPSKTIEYMASGKPIAMFKLDGIPDEYDEYLNYFSDNSPKAIGELLLEICLDNTGYYKNKAILGADFVRKNKNGIVQAEKILKLITTESDE